ncbi:isochorismatase family protein [Dyadobacter psychrotolerans]|uniref:Isochorismatase family protein n=1 Tax=Dyadobacter psychrotolerans TaxID=2541721 RepID=A0A4R5DP90_9BACT|nr:isochorismatase family protein [Dyadobacter psychrotolerans]TDE16162.1 isochorismatase family protein [Dyadobacter psychrotolerans]
MKISPTNSILLVIDIQEKLLPKIDQKDEVFKTVIRVVDLAKTIGIPVLLTEHFPEKIGATPTALRSKVDQSNIVSKTYFSAVTEGNLVNNFDDNRRQVVVVGTETHICVLQTVLDLLAIGYHVFVVDTGVGSRLSHDNSRGLQRMKQNGAEIITKDMLAFEWLEKAGTDLFKEVLETFVKD